MARYVTQPEEGGKQPDFLRDEECSGNPLGENHPRLPQFQGNPERVMLFLPLRMMEPKNHLNLLRQSGADTPPSDTPLSQPLRVLVVDDNALVRYGFVHNLKTMGCYVVSVENGLHALNAFGMESFDLVLMDGDMPVMDGFEASHRIKNSLGLLQIPRIVMVSAVFDVSPEEMVASGIDAFLAKPVLRPQLEEVIAETRTLLRPAPASPIAPPAPVPTVAH
jgi:CheY-like chemotaxis protein